MFAVTFRTGPLAQMPDGWAAPAGAFGSAVVATGL